MSKRAGVFDVEDDLDVSGFKPQVPEKSRAAPEQVRTVSEAAQFLSREPRREEMLASPSKREPRRHRTGRNIQLNIKARAEAIEAFYAIADQRGWVLGETFERAIDALRRDLATQE
jgi:hypothetical protein